MNTQHAEPTTHPTRKAQPVEPPRGPQRLAALDQMRGVVMLLMTVDHASEFLNRGRLTVDAAWLWKPGSALPAGQFLLRWVTHLCAPTFVFLAGVGIALSSAKRRARGASEGSLSRSLAARGLFIALLDPLWMSPVMMEGSGILFQVLYAIGGSMLLMALLRRVPARLLLATGLLFYAGSEWCSQQVGAGGAPGLPAALLLTPGRFPLQLGPLHVWMIIYPVLPWLAIMLLGFACARALARDDSRGRVERTLRYAGLAALAVFALVRGANGYGNMGLLRDDASPLQWLHVSKYPPSLSYVALELGVMALLLSLLYRLDRRRPKHVLLAGPLAALGVLGRAALFYYVLHIHVLAALTWLFGLHHAGAIGLTLAGATLTLLALSLPVARYQRYKAAHPDSLARYL